MSDIQNLQNFLHQYLNLPTQVGNAEAYFAMSIVLIIFVAGIIMAKTGNGKASIVGAFIPLTICTLLQFIPLLPSLIIYAALAFGLARLIFGGQ